MSSVIMVAHNKASKPMVAKPSAPMLGAPVLPEAGQFGVPLVKQYQEVGKVLGSDSACLPDAGSDVQTPVVAH